MKQSKAINPEHQTHQSSAIAQNNSIYADAQQSAGFIDNRKEVTALTQLMACINTSPKMIAQRKLAASFRNNPHTVVQQQQKAAMRNSVLQQQEKSDKELLQDKIKPVQRIEKEKLTQAAIKTNIDHPRTSQATDSATHINRSLSSADYPKGGTIQRKVYINEEPYSFEEETKRLHNRGKDEKHTFTPSEPNKAKVWASDLWSRFYLNVSQFQDHVSGVPVTVGLFKPLGIWYELPFRTGRPFVLGENHSTKVAPIMDESNRKGTLLHENHGVLPIKQKTAREVKQPESAYQKTAMESVFAKTYFGVAYHTPDVLKPKKSTPNVENVESDEWITGYAMADRNDRSIDSMNRPGYKDKGEAITKIQGTPGVKAYDSLRTMERVKHQFDEEAEIYIKENAQTKPGAAELVKTTQKNLDAWWKKMNLLGAAYSEQKKNSEFEELIKEINTLQASVLESLDKLFKTEYQDEINTEFGKREKSAEKVLSNLNKNVQHGMAMRDLAMLTVIKNASTNWGNLEMISMGSLHVQTQKDTLKQIDNNMPIITREEFINGSKNALPE